MFISVYFFAFLLSLLFSRGGSANTLAFIRRRHYCLRTRTGSSSENSLRMKARPAPLESMVIIVERSAMHIRSGPVRALFSQDQFNKELHQLINNDILDWSRVIHILTAPRL